MKAIAVIAIIFILVFAVASHAKDFSAEMLSTAQGEQDITGKLYTSGEKSRMETPEAVTITRLDKRVVWMIFPDERAYMEQPLRLEDVMASGKVPDELERTFLGNEAVEGRGTKKYRITYATGAAGAADGRKESVYAWIDNELDIPVKIADPKGKWSVLFKNIKTGTQPASLFEPPKGYKKLSYDLTPLDEDDDDEEEGGAEAGNDRFSPGNFKMPKFW